MDGTTPIRLLIALSDERDQLFNSEYMVARIAPPYYLFKDRSADVALASPLGGPPTLAPDIRQPSREDLHVKRFLSDRTARDDLADCLPINQVVIEDFDAAFCIGISGSIWATSEGGLAPTVRSFLDQGKPVAVVPGRRLDLTSDRPRGGVLIVCDTKDSPILAAHALFKVASVRRRLLA